MRSFLDFYEATLDYDKRNKEGFKPIEDRLKKVEELKDLKDLNGKLVDFTLNGIGLPISSYIDMDMENTNKKEYYFEMPGIFLIDKSYYKEANPTGNMLNEAYKDVFSKSLMMLGKTSAEAQKITKNALEFDRKVAEYSLPQEEQGDMLVSYNLTKLGDFVKKSKVLDLDAYLTALLGKSPEKVIVSHKKYYDNFDRIINDDNFDQIRDWMYIRTLFASSSYLSEEFELISGQIQMLLNGIEEPTPRDERAYDLSSAAYSGVVGNYFGKKYFGPEAKEDVTKMTNDFIKTYKLRLEKIDWLTEETKKEAIKKLDNMTVNIGYEDKISPVYKNMIYDKSKSLYENVIDFERKMMEEDFKNYSKPVDKDKWLIDAQEVNAAYAPLNNSITFPAGILQKPFYSLEQTPSQNYGGIGAVIAHEISHAFDPNGSKFDEVGNLKDWWTKEDHIEFQKKTEEMVKLFDGIPYADGKVNGRLTVGENIADAGGVSVAYDVARNSKGFNPDEFFKSWALIWRMKSTRELENTLLIMDEHSPNKVRTNLQLSNFDPFYEVYNIEKTDKMYIDPKDRVKVWEQN